MTADDLAQRLHDKTTRGEPLSAEEQAQLEQWYARQDREEDDMLAETSTPQEITTVQAQVDAAVAQLVTTTQRIQALTAENEAARREVADLKRQLAQKRATQPA
jgi:predicted RNase H-like nuclease (RuvC/YqgF family)